MTLLPMDDQEFCFNPMARSDWTGEQAMQEHHAVVIGPNEITRVITMASSAAKAISKVVALSGHN